MKDIAKMRVDVLREIKSIRKFFDIMENNVKSRNELAIKRAYVFLSTLVYHMDEGDLTPNTIRYNMELAIAFHELDELNCGDN